MLSICFKYYTSAKYYIFLSQNSIASHQVTLTHFQTMSQLNFDFIIPKLFDQKFKLCLNRKPYASHRNFSNFSLFYAFADIQ